MPKVSVILPTYNRAAMIGDAIRSVTQQSDTDWELIIVDDGSTDETSEVVATFDDPRIRYLVQTNQGPAAARNAGIRTAHGRYIAFLDSDDLFLPDKLAAQAARLDASPKLGLVGAGHVEMDEQLRVLREVHPWHRHPRLELRDWLLACPLSPSVALARREWLERAGLFDQRMQRVEDWDLWLRMSQLGCPMGWVQETLCGYRWHGGNRVRDVQLMKAGMLQMLDKLYAGPDLPGDIVAARACAYANAHLDAAARAYAQGAVVEGKADLGRAIELHADLLEGTPPAILSTLASFALTPLAGDADRFMETVVRDLPESTGIPRWSTFKVRALLYAVRAFDHHQRSERPAAARQALLALAHDPTWARNRGVLSILRSGLWGYSRTRTRA